eukprot:scaffold260784_cov26-Tisochrysis_lutea.AAC.3
MSRRAAVETTAELARCNEGWPCELGIFSCCVCLVDLQEAGSLLLEEHLLRRLARHFVVGTLQAHEELLSVGSSAISVEGNPKLEEGAASQLGLVGAPILHRLQLRNRCPPVAVAHQLASSLPGSRDLRGMLLLKLERVRFGPFPSSRLLVLLVATDADPLAAAIGLGYIRRPLEHAPAPNLGPVRLGLRGI